MMMGTALIGHRYWTITGADQVASMDGFYKNLSIMAGFLLLCFAGRDIRSMHCAVSRGHNLCAIGPTMQHHVV
jgi:uncharacterized membrane protein YphA (DoxX/SURF4 family)